MTELKATYKPKLRSGETSGTDVGAKATNALNRSVSDLNKELKPLGVKVVEKPMKDWRRIDAIDSCSASAGP